MSSEHYLREISSKLYKSKGHDYNELTANSIYAHNTTLDKFKKLKITDNDELITTDNLLITQILVDDSLLVAGSVYTSNSFEITKLNKPSFLLTADGHINQLSFDLLISNDDTNFYTLSSHYLTEHISELSNQIILGDFHFKYYKLRIENTSGSDDIRFSVSTNF